MAAIILVQLWGSRPGLALVVIFLRRKDKEPSKRIILDLFCFLLLVLPIIGRLAAVPIAMFNYLAFIIPTTLFLLLYTASIYLSIDGFKRNRIE